MYLFWFNVGGFDCEWCLWVFVVRFVVWSCAFRRLIGRETFWRDVFLTRVARMRVCRPCSWRCGLESTCCLPGLPYYFRCRSFLRRIGLQKILSACIRLNVSRAPPFRRNVHMTTWRLVAWGLRFFDGLVDEWILSWCRRCGCAWRLADWGVGRIRMVRLSVLLIWVGLRFRLLCLGARVSCLKLDEWHVICGII